MADDNNIFDKMIEMGMGMTMARLMTVCNSGSVFQHMGMCFFLFFQSSFLQSGALLIIANSLQKATGKV